MPALPVTTEEILLTGIIDPEFKAAVEAKQYPPGSSYTIEQLKEINKDSLSGLQERLKQSQPSSITECERYITFSDSYRSRILVCHRSGLAPTAKCPLVVFVHGGGHCVGHPESEIPLARRLVLEFNAIVVLPTYRQAPENPFPASIADTWATVEYLAEKSLQSQDSDSPFLPAQSDPRRGFIIAGTSAGAGIAASIAHLARNQKLNPPITGQALIAGTFISYKHVPTRYKPLYLAREQNKDAPILDLALYTTFQNAFRPDHQSPLWAIFDQHHPLDRNLEDPADPGVKHGHLDLPPAYFQICGMDISRDDSLIYEQVLREECNIKTKVNIYPGYAHVWWALFPELKASIKRENDVVAGVGWLLDSK